MDRELLEAAQRGDEAAFVDLIRPRTGRLFAVAHRILHDTDRADDALQEALVHAWRDLRALRDPDRLDAWLTRIVVHESIDAASSERRRVSVLRQLPLDGPTGPDPTGDVADRDLLERAFRHLTPEQRAILTLHHYLGYASPEIGHALGIPPGTARSRLHHAHRALRAALDADARSVVASGEPA